MFWQNFEKLLGDLFREINVINSVPSPTEIFNNHHSEIEALLKLGFDEQFVRLSDSPKRISPKVVETARMLSLLKQRRSFNNRGKNLVGRIRAAVISRERPPFNVPVNSLSNEMLEIGKIGNNSFYSKFQIEGWRKTLVKIDKAESLVILAPTGAGKSEVFMLPLIYKVAMALKSGGNPNNDPRFILIYPRVELLKDQLERLFRYAYYAEKEVYQNSLVPSRKKKGIVIGFQFAGISTDSSKTLQNEDLFESSGIFKIIEKCPICKEGRLEVQRKTDGVCPLKCNNANCDAIFQTTLSKKDHVKVKPHFLVTTSASLSNFYLSSQKSYDEYLESITGLIFDEAHLYYSLEGTHLHNLIQGIENLRGSSKKLLKIASSATITSPETFAAKLFHGKERPHVQVHDARLYESEPAGLEVLFFLQSPNGDDVPQPTSTMIQTVMAVGHGVFDEQPQETMERAILFTDSVDVANRFQGQIQDAESDGLLWTFRTDVPRIFHDGNQCPKDTPFNCNQLYLEGECWRGIIGGIECVTTKQVRHSPMLINCVSSQNKSSYWNGEIIVATSSLEVGVDDSRIKATLHYRPPRDVFSFIQRRGRAGRRRGDVAYSVIVLGNESSDQFYLYRRNRLLTAQNYELPLNPENPVISRMHQLLTRERNSLRQLSDKNGIQKAILQWFYATLRNCSLVKNIYSVKLDQIKTYKTEPQQLALMQWFREERDKFRNVLDIFWNLEEIENQCPSSLLPEVEEIKTLLTRLLDGETVLRNDIQVSLKQLANNLDDLVFDESDPDVIAEIQGLAEKLKVNLREVWKAAAICSQLKVSSDKLNALYNFFNTLSEKIDEKWKINYAPEMIKALLQAFFYLGLATRKDESHEECQSCVEYFIPDAAFQQVKPLLVEIRDQASPTHPSRLAQESVSDLSAMFYPYKTIYRYFGSKELTIIDTHKTQEKPTVISGVTTVKLKLKGEGFREADRFIPQKIQVRSLRSDDDSHGFVKLCESCYSVYGLNRTLRCCGSQPLSAVKLYADPIIERNARLVNDLPPTPITRTIDFLELDGETKVLGAYVSANKLKWDHDQGRYNWIKNAKLEFIARYDSPIAYNIPTKGIRWDLSGIINQILHDENLQSRIGIKKITKELILHTAVHLLYKAISSISGVNLNVLEYSTDADKDQVFVWERYDGGAGITETIRESIKTNPLVFFKELLASVLCPISLDEDTTWTNPDELRKRLAADWYLPESDDFLDIIISEAESERQQTELRKERERENLVSCKDGCPVCIEVTTCTDKPSQNTVTSRNVAEAILRSFLRKVTKTEYLALIDDGLLKNIIPPTILFANPEKGESDVLLL